MIEHALKRCLSPLIAGFLGIAVWTTAYAFEIEIQISPSVLNIGSSGQVVTVHTDIAYSQVYAYSVQLNGITIANWKADDQGNFVAKFDIDAVKSLDGLIIGDDNKLTLIGATIDDEAFLGTDLVKVIDIVPRGR